VRSVVNRPGDYWTGPFLDLLAVGLGIAFVWAFVLSSYFGVNLPQSLVFLSSDGWCPPGANGLGAHCWGDFAAVGNFTFTDTPQGPESPYQMSSRVLRVPFAVVWQMAGFGVALTAYLVVVTACLLAPIVWATRSLPLARRLMAIMVAAVATTPFLYALDRGNSVALAVPFVLLFGWGLLRDRMLWAVIGVVIASSVKPQYAFLMVAFIALRRWWPLMSALLGVGLTFILPYFALGGGWVEGLKEWVRASQAWSTGQPLWVDWPANHSFAKALFDATHWLGQSFPGSALNTTPDRWAALCTLAATAFVLIAGTALAAFGGRLNRVEVVAVALALACLAVPLAFGYYAVFALVTVGLLIGAERTSAGEPPVVPPTRAWALSAALLVTLTPVLLPRGDLLAADEGQALVVASWMPTLSTLAWMCFIGVTLTSAARSKARDVSTAREVTSAPLP